MIETKDLALTVERQVPGELVTNALKIQAFVLERVKDYTVEKYYDNPDAAKKDRAALNSASKDLNQRRLALEREFMAPFEEFKAVINHPTTVIDSAASKLDEVVKAVEETIKNEKKIEIQGLFSGKKFDLVTLDRIFDPKWLNATVKMKTVESEMDARIAKIYSDIATIEALGSDSIEVKAVYLDTLDIGTALATAQRLKQNRERAEKEKEEREARLHADHIKAQSQEIATDAIIEVKNDAISSVVADALEIEKDPIIEFTIRFRGTRAQLLAMRQYITSMGIEYEKL